MKNDKTKPDQQLADDQETLSVPLQRSQEYLDLPSYLDYRRKNRVASQMLAPIPEEKIETGKKKKICTIL